MIFRDITAVILCGGLSSRMNTPKHKLFMPRILEQLSGFENIALSVRDEGQIDSSSYPLWADMVKGKGPLCGILTALKKADTSRVFVMPCDVPGVTAEFIAALYEAVNDYDICTLPIIDGEPEPLIGIYHVSCAEGIERALTEGRYSVKDFLKSIDVNYVNFGKEYHKVFRNINTPEEYINWQKSIKVSEP